MGQVPFVDVTGARAIRNLAADCVRRGTRLILCEVQPEVAAVLNELGEGEEQLQFAADYGAALALAASQGMRRIEGPFRQR